MVTVRSFLAAICFSNVVVSHSEKLRQKDVRFNFGELKSIFKQYNCEGLVGETESDTNEMLRECHILMKTHAMQQTKEYLRNAPIQELTKARIEYHERSPKRRKRSPGECPTMNRSYMEGNDVMDGARSLSPYRSQVDYNPNRFPKFIFEASCLCSGCLDPASETEIFFNSKGMGVFSDVVEYEFLFYFLKPGTRVYQRKVAKHAIGCMCQFV